MTAFTAADKLHRLVKHALDSGAAASIGASAMTGAGTGAASSGAGTMPPRQPANTART